MQIQQNIKRGKSIHMPGSSAVIIIGILIMGSWRQCIIPVASVCPNTIPHHKGVLSMG